MADKIGTHEDIREGSENGSRVSPAGGYFTLAADTTYHFFIGFERIPDSHHSHPYQVQSFESGAYNHRYRGSAPSSLDYARFRNLGGACEFERYKIADWEKGLRLSHSTPGLFLSVSRGDLDNFVTAHVLSQSNSSTANIGRGDPLVGMFDWP